MRSAEETEEIINCLGIPSANQPLQRWYGSVAHNQLGLSRAYADFFSMIMDSNAVIRLEDDCPANWRTESIWCEKKEHETKDFLDEKTRDVQVIAVLFDPEEVTTYLVRLTADMTGAAIDAAVSINVVGQMKDDLRTQLICYLVVVWLVVLPAFLVKPIN